MDPQSYRALSDYLLTYSYSILVGNISAIVFVLSWRRFRAAPFDDGVPLLYFRSPVGQFIRRFVSSDPCVGFDVSDVDVVSSLVLQQPVCMPCVP